MDTDVHAIVDTGVDTIVGRLRIVNVMHGLVEVGESWPPAAVDRGRTDDHASADDGGVTVERGTPRASVSVSHGLVDNRDAWPGRAADTPKVDDSVGTPPAAEDPPITPTVSVEHGLVVVGRDT